jgi:hypothetical protein
MPTPYHDLQTMKQEGLKAFNQLQLNQEKDEKIDRVVKFLEDVDKLLNIASTPPPAPIDPAAMAAQQQAAAGAPAVAMPPAAMPPNQLQ